MEEDSQDEFGAAYERLFAICGPLTFPAPWDFLRPHSYCRGPVHDPEATLAGLRAEFPDPLLSAAGLLEPGPDGRGRLPRRWRAPPPRSSPSAATPWPRRSPS
jgi:hypothetical protein